MSVWPDLGDLFDLGDRGEVDGESDPSQPWVNTFVLTADDGDRLSVTWDEVACSVTLVWTHEGRHLLTSERETVTLLSVRREGQAAVVTVTAGAGGLTNSLTGRVGSVVAVTDTLLRI